MNKNKKEEVKKVIVDFIKNNELSIYEYKNQNNFIFDVAKVIKYKLHEKNTAKEVVCIYNQLDTLSVINDLVDNNENDIEKMLILNSMNSAQLLVSLLNKVDLKTIKQISFLNNGEFFLWDKIYKDWTMIITYINTLNKNAENMNLIKFILNNYSATISNYNVKILINIFDSLKNKLNPTTVDNLFFNWCKNHKDYINKKKEVLNFILTFIEKSFTETNKYSNLFHKNIKNSFNPLKMQVKPSVHVNIDVNTLYEKYQIAFEKVQKTNYPSLLIHFLKDFQESDLIQKMNIDFLYEYKQPHNMIMVIYSKYDRKINYDYTFNLIEMFLNEVFKSYKNESMLFSLDIKKKNKLTLMNKDIIKQLEIIYNHESTRLSLNHITKENPKKLKKI